MNKRLYVGNLEYSTTDEELKDLFSSEGKVIFSKVVTYTDGKSKGFGFVDMLSKDEAEKAIEEMNGKDFMGRVLNVNEARPKTERRGGGGKRGGFGGRRGGRGRSGRSGGGGRY